MNKLLIFALPAVLLFASGCAIVGINVKHKTPKKAFKYPTFTHADTLRGKLSNYRTCYDVNFYNIDIEVNPDDKFIKGFADFHFINKTDFDTIQIDLYENMKINGIICDSDSLRYERIYNAVFVYFNQSQKKDQQTIMTVYYEGNPHPAKRPPWDGGFVWKKDKSKNPWIGVACELDGASLWWPVKDHLYDEPDSLSMSVTIPEGLFCVSNGKLINRTKKDNKETFTWKTSYPINTYNATLYIGNYKHFKIPYSNNESKFDLDFYVLPENLDSAKTHFKQTVDMIKLFEKRFGEYPWQKDGFKLVESPYAGMEHQSAIAYGNGYKNDKYHKFDYIILHETAHEWWGNSVSAKDYAEIWLHEGFATYSEALYVEHTKGYDKYLNYLRFYSWLIKNKRPMVGPFDVNYWDYKDGDVYMKGALVLHTLRNAIANDTLFFDIIHTFYNDYKYSIATSNDFINLVNEKTNSEYNWLFNQYLYDRTCPQLEWNYFYDPTKMKNFVKYRWTNINSDFPLPIKIEIEGGEEALIHPSKNIQSYEVNTGVWLNTNASYIRLKRNKKLY